ncbi:hypothetical protein RJT34_16902 [Clitoria ternatea]|uniref:Uncharacterized protein n=1 Tax=Clitoria ternatea TaxID=43366 RepID=A0AAN9PE31_CLITE
MLPLPGFLRSRNPENLPTLSDRYLEALGIPKTKYLFSYAICKWNEHKCLFPRSFLPRLEFGLHAVLPLYISLSSFSISESLELFYLFTSTNTSLFASNNATRVCCFY